MSIDTDRSRRRGGAEAYLCRDGWYEIRDCESPHRWIATDAPVPVRD